MKSCEPLPSASVRIRRALLAMPVLLLLIGCQGLTVDSHREKNSFQSEVYRCKNDMEIQCDSSSCEHSKDGFTAMDVEFDVIGNLSVCAYSGCWQGRARALNLDDFLVLTAHDMKFSTSEESQSVAIILDPRDSVAVIKVGGFAQPLLCEDSTM